jgi:Tfp pilus assembly protein PilO
MSARDRLAVMAIAALAVLGVAWMLAVSPAREQASKLGSEVATARGALAAAQSESSSARNAQQRYRTAYASLASLGKAVPTSAEVPALMYAIDQASDRKKVEFTSITSGGSGSGSGSSASPATTASSTFTQMPFTFVFDGSYSDLIRLLGQLEGFTVQSRTGAVRVSGRLLTIQSITLVAPPSGASGSSGQGGAKASSAMTWTITATAYVLPAGQATSGGAGPSGPAGAAAQPASSSTGAGSSAATAPAVVRATP